MNKITAGLLFAAFWGSGSVFLKLGIKNVHPLVLIDMRFLIAAILMLFFAIFIKKEPLPKSNEWVPLIICGILNMAIYAMLFIFALKEITPGIGTLASATCPLIISILNALWYKQKITLNMWMALCIGIIGISIAIFPLLINAHASILGIVLLSLSMICYSVGTVYYQQTKWVLPRLSITAWQVLFGGIILIPFTFYFYDKNENHYNLPFLISLIWLVVPITIIATQLWLYLLKIEPQKASLWLFLCPIFGFAYSYIFFEEPIGIYTIIGTILVIFALYLGQKKHLKLSQKK